MKTTGTILKEKRETLSLTISEVALSTKINPKILVSMESGDLERLPAHTFLKGFVRSYASYLKLDPEELVKIFNEEVGASRVEKPIENKTEPTPPTRRGVAPESSAKMGSLAAVVIVLLIGVIFGVRELIEKYQKETLVTEAKDLKVTPLPEVTEATAVAKSSEVVVAVPQKFATAESIAAAAVPILPKNLNTNLLVAKPPEKPPEKPHEVKPSEKKPETTAVTAIAVAAKADEVQPVAEKPSETKPGLKLTKNEIIIEALDKVDVRFEIKGETKRLSLAPNQVHTIRADSQVQFDFSDGGAVSIILNGHDRGVPGDLGKPKQVKIP